MERSRLDQVKNKILEKVKKKKVARENSRDRRDSISSLGSAKRGGGDQDESECSRQKTDFDSLLVLPSIKIQ